jgi:type IX secretion system PorP/SprF family membrane protein
MKKLLIILSLIMMNSRIFSQLYPLSDYYIYNGMAINPAFAGSADALSATAEIRDQWVGFKDAPKSGIVTVHTPVFHDKMGLGLLVDFNSYGAFRQNSFMGNYAYRHDLFKGKLSAGMAFGATAYHISWDRLEATDPDDELLDQNADSWLLPEFSLGAYYYTKKYFAGISIPFFLSHVSDEATGKYRATNRFSDYSYFFTTGYNASLSTSIILMPAILMKYNSKTKMQVDYYLQAEFKERIRVGLGFRNPGMLIGMITCHVNRQLLVAYSYDFDPGSAGRYKNGSHEIVVGYVFRYVRNAMSPRSF